MMLAILFSLKTMESLHFWVTPLFSMKTEPLAPPQSYCTVDADVWCKLALTQKIQTLFQLVCVQQTTDALPFVIFSAHDTLTILCCPYLMTTQNVSVLTKHRYKNTPSRQRQIETETMTDKSRYTERQTGIDKIPMIDYSWRVRDY